LSLSLLDRVIPFYAYLGQVGKLLIAGLARGEYNISKHTPPPGATYKWLFEAGLQNESTKIIMGRLKISMEDFQQDVKQIAGQNFREGYNCAEAILRAFNQKLDLGLGDESLKLAAGFGGGIGHAGCVCGALAASIMVLGVLQGRSSKEQDREPAYRASDGFHRRFSDNFGGTCCRCLNPHPFETREHLRNCLKITGTTAELLMGYIEENGLLKNRL
jgi:C_GCAxxG_C_C family probable redox protein